MVALDQETLDLFRADRARRSRRCPTTTEPPRSRTSDGATSSRPTPAPSCRSCSGSKVSAGRGSAVLDDVAIEAMNPASAAWLDDLGAASYVHPQPGPRTAGRLDGGDLVVDGLALRGSRDGRVVTVAHGEDGLRLVLAPTSTLEHTPINGMDPTLELVRVTGTVRGSAFEVCDAAAPHAAEPACRRALAYELVGLGSAMLDLTAEYAGARMQFGQPIGAFQAVKHRLADVLVAVRAAEVAADESWNEDPAFAAAVAKCLAGRAFRLAAENCLQVMGAIGFTLEHELHRFIWRGTVLDVLLGSARELRLEVGRTLVERGRVPRPGAL